MFAENLCGIQRIFYHWPALLHAGKYKYIPTVVIQDQITPHKTEKKTEKLEIA